MPIIYVKLLNEGTAVFKPVNARKLSASVFEIDPNAAHDSADEVWEFTPGMRVEVSEQTLSGERVLVADRLKQRDT